MGADLDKIENSYEGSRREEEAEPGGGEGGTATGPAPY